MAVVDIGSNSVRLVVYEGLTRSPTPIFNEKVLCGLGREVQSTGLLASDAVAKALPALQRFRGLCDRIEVPQVYAIATAACRDAKNGKEFIGKAERICGTKIEVISGKREAELAALGVVSGFHRPDGIVGDLGGGSLELTDVHGHRLGAGGVPSILLKGATIATWLYDDGRLRPYRDIDLLVPAARFTEAKSILADLGYVHRLSGAHPTEIGLREQVLFGPEGVCIDLHHGLIGVAAPADMSWKALWSRTVAFRLAGDGEVRALAVPARAMHLALHVAQNGPIDQKAITDLELGLAKVSREEWWEAAAIAEELDASPAFAAGLRLVPAGRALADELSLTHRTTVELTLRIRSAPQDAIFFERLVEASGFRTKVALVARKLFPTAAYLRANSPATARGPLGLARSAFVHQMSIAVRLAPAFAAWRKARAAMVDEAKR